MGGGAPGAVGACVGILPGGCRLWRDDAAAVLKGLEDESAELDGQLRMCIPTSNAGNTAAQKWQCCQRRRRRRTCMNGDVGRCRACDGGRSQRCSDARMPRLCRLHCFGGLIWAQLARTSIRAQPPGGSIPGRVISLAFRALIAAGALAAARALTSARAVAGAGALVAAEAPSAWQGPHATRGTIAWFGDRLLLRRCVSWVGSWGLLGRVLAADLDPVRWVGSCELGPVQGSAAGEPAGLPPLPPLLWAALAPPPQTARLPQRLRQVRQAAPAARVRASPTPGGCRRSGWAAAGVWAQALAAAPAWCCRLRNSFAAAAAVAAAAVIHAADGEAAAAAAAGTAAGKAAPQPAVRQRRLQVQAACHLLAALPPAQPPAGPLAAGTSLALAAARPPRLCCSSLQARRLRRPPQAFQTVHPPASVRLPRCACCAEPRPSRRAAMGRTAAPVAEAAPANPARPRPWRDQSRTPAGSSPRRQARRLRRRLRHHSAQQRRRLACLLRTSAAPHCP
eukprot:356861-Chlamydomonas_euryale.AAC.2